MEYATMDGDAVKAAREELELTQAELAAALELDSKYGKDAVRAWERGRREITGPARVALRFMLAAKRGKRKPLSRD